MASRVDNFLERRKFWDKKWSHDYNSRISSISGILQSRVKQESQNAFVQNQAHLSHAQFIERMHHEAIQRGTVCTCMCISRYACAYVRVCVRVCNVICAITVCVLCRYIHIHAQAAS
jgi:hypothetical protein